jgi:hypothetical protein
MVAGALLCVLMPGVMSSPALTINGALVPAENYAPANAAGDPPPQRWLSCRQSK